MARPLNLPLMAELAAALGTTEKNALARLTGLKLTPVCDRCGGCGQYSFNQVDGSTCYGCGGTGHRWPRPAEMAGLVEVAREAAQDGRLADYLRVLEARRTAKAGRARISEVYGKTPMQLVMAGYASHVIRDEEVGGNWIDLRTAITTGHDAFKAAEAAIAAATWAKPAQADYAALQLAAERAIEDAIRIIEESAVEPDATVIAFAQAKQRTAAERLIEKGYTPGWTVYGEDPCPCGKNAPLAWAGAAGCKACCKELEQDAIASGTNPNGTDEGGAR